MGREISSACWEKEGLQGQKAHISLILVSPFRDGVIPLTSFPVVCLTAWVCTAALWVPFPRVASCWSLCHAVWGHLVTKVIFCPHGPTLRCSCPRASCHLCVMMRRMQQWDLSAFSPHVTVPWTASAVPSIPEEQHSSCEDLRP